MTNNQINRKEMMDAVLAYLDSNVSKWSSISKLGEFKNELSLINQQIDEAQEAQQQAKVYVGKNKILLKKAIADKADIINDIVETYAIVTENAELESKMADSYSVLNKLKTKDFELKIKEIITEAENHCNALCTEYGLTNEQITDLKSDLDEFLNMLGLPRAYQISSVQSTKNLESLFSESKEVLTQKLDKAMKLFKRRDTIFYNGYLAARVVIDN